MRKMIFTLVLTIVSSVWMTNEAGNWCMPAAQTSTEQPIRIGGTFQTDILPCVDETEPCPPCLTIVLASGGHYYLVSDDPQVLAILDTISTGSFAIIEGNHYLEGHYDFIHVTHIFFPETDITQLTGEWEVYKETVSTPTGDAGTRWFSTHDVNNTNYIIENNSIYKVVLDQASGYAHYTDIVPYSIDKKENGTWLLTAEGMFSSSDPVEEGIPTPVTIYKLTENEIEWMYAANGGDEGPNYYYQYLRQNTYAQNDKLPSLCDEWNIAKISNATGPIETIYTVKAFLGSDTIIESHNYVKLIEDGGYKGSMREGESGVIYYIPAGSAHEYLLYNFNAKVGDKLSNLWYGGDPERCPNGYNATVLSISNETPRVFTVEVEYILSDSDGEHIIPWTIYWTEGVGLSDGPAGQFCPGPDCACSCGQVLLCAYKNGEQVYVSEMGEQYGCVYNYDPYAAPADTIPLFSYTGDDPGSSTVDPVDPNQVVATLQGDQLTIHEHSGVDVTYTLRHNAPAQMPARAHTSASDTFRNEITLQITESGEYQLLLTNPSWDYSIYGTFFYSPQGIESVHSTSLPQKVLQNGQFYILRNGKVYTITGQKLK